MPSQIVVLPSHLLATIAGHRPIRFQFAFGSLGMGAEAGRLASGDHMVRIEIDRHMFCPDVPNRLHDFVHALLLTSDPKAAGLVPPVHLPDGLICHVLDLVEGALTQLRHLTGHDKLEIAACFSDARKADPIVLPPPRQSPADADETDRLQLGRELQARLQPELSRIDSKLARYGINIRKSHLETAVVRLGLQADLGAALRLDQSNGKLIPRLNGSHRRKTFAKLWQSNQNTLSAFQTCLDRIHWSSTAGKDWLGSTLLPLHSTLLERIAPPFRSGRFRSPHMRILSVAERSLHKPTIPAEEVPAAIRAFAHGFDARLWRDIHPLVRAGMEHIELMAIHPFGDGNGRLGRLLLQAMLIEDGVPGLPLEAVFKWNRDSYLERVDRAVRLADLLGFMHFLLRAVDKAIELGRHFTRALTPYRQYLLSAFADGGTEFAVTAAEHAASMVLGPDVQFAVRATIGPEDICSHLASAGFDPVATGNFDLCGRRIQSAWSSPVARDLLLAPPARI